MISSCCPRNDGNLNISVRHLITVSILMYKRMFTYFMTMQNCVLGAQANSWEYKGYPEGELSLIQSVNDCTHV
ncbi:WD repeat-containing protein on Y chromosome [Frankliniella fusca]|uniref:WD repeat-containing protein on Y chromosome n=1 Tax=Frankliniella fusca TaxID=407009 RepID=A0AAE1LF30_9NEOP|nr:WD repeat-containing protein on Y chromosome [Frankliniella fusca]